MTGENTKIPLGAALTLAEVTRALLYKKETTESGQEAYVDRILPFRLRYSLNKNLVVLEKYVRYYNQQKLIMFAEYGEASTDQETVDIKDPEKKKEFSKKLNDMLESYIIIDIMAVEPEDLELLKDTDIVISPEAMALFIAYMTRDEKLIESINTKVVLSLEKMQINSEEKIDG